MCVCVCSGVGRFKKFTVNQVTFSTFWKPSTIICSRCTHTQARAGAHLRSPTPALRGGRQLKPRLRRPWSRPRPRKLGGARRAAPAPREQAIRGGRCRARGAPVSPTARAGARKCGGCQGAERRLPARPGSAPRLRGAAVPARSGC